MDFCKDITAFHTRFKVDYTGPPRPLKSRLHQFRAVFLAEELHEYNLAYIPVLETEYTGDRDVLLKALADQLDALVDLVYVALGTAHLHGFDFDEAWARVHEANMLKQGVERAADSKRGSSFDVIKPRGWVAPDLRDLVR